MIENDHSDDEDEPICHNKKMDVIYCQQCVYIKLN